jgi:hypothetical protein
MGTFFSLRFQFFFIYPDVVIHHRLSG